MDCTSTLLRRGWFSTISVLGGYQDSPFNVAAVASGAAPPSASAWRTLETTSRLGQSDSYLAKLER